MSDLLPTAEGAEVRRMLTGLLRQRRGPFAAAVVALLGATAAALVSPVLIGTLVDRVTAGDGHITGPVLGLLGAALAETLLSGLAFALVPGVGQPVLAELRERVVDRALHLPADRLERAGRGDLLSRVGDDVASVSEALEILPSLAGAALSIGLGVGTLAALDPRLGLAALVIVPVQAYAVRWYLRRARRAYRAEREAGGARAQALLQTLDGARTIRALGLADAERPRVATRSQAAAGATVLANRIATGFYSRLNLAEFAGTAAVLAAGFFLVRADALTIGGATAGALLFVRLFDQFNIALGSVDDAQRALAGLRRLVGVAALPPIARGGVAAPAGGAVDVRDIHHRYGAGEPVLHGVGVRLDAGERVALVGVSGAGKTTLAKVVAGFHVPTGGTVSVGGVPLGALNPAALRRAVALITQEVHVFGGTVADNLTLTAPGATREELVAALDLAGARDWAEPLLDTEVGGGGVRLTALQAQQLALARLALTDPLVAVLDEATADAGSAGARTLEAAAERLLRGRTALVVAHRLTQAASADRIVVMDAGRVVETGPHAELVAAGGAYARLWAAWDQSSSSSQSPERNQ